MTLHHFTIQAIDGRWHAVYRVPLTGYLHSVTDDACRVSVERECRRLNDEQKRKDAAAQAAAVPPADRPIPRGFYTDKDAA